VANKIYNKYKEPRYAEFSRKDLVIDIKNGHLYYKSNIGIHRMASELVSDTFGATDTEIVINNVYNVGIPPTFKSDGIRLGDGLIGGNLTVSGSTSGSITAIGPSGSVHINNLGSGSISASGFLFANLENSNNIGLKTVVYNTGTGKFFITGSYGGGGGGSAVIDTVSDTSGQTGIDFTLSAGDLSAVASGLDTNDDVAFAQISASGNLFANLPDGFQNVATYNSQSGQLFYTSSAGLFAQMDTFKSTGQRSGNSAITGSLVVLGEVSSSNTGSFRHLFVSPNVGTLSPTYNIDLGVTLGEFIGDKESIVIKNAYSDGDYYIGNSAFKNGFIYRDNAGGVITLYSGSLAIQTTEEGTYIQKPATNFGTTGNRFAGVGNALQVEGRISSSGDLVVNQGSFQTIQGNVTASGNISASGLLFASASLGFQNVATYNSESGEFHYTSSQGLSEGLDTFKVTGQRDGDSSITGSLTVTGTITAQEFHTEFVSSSIIFESGSTKFGDTLDDVHNMTGSLNVTGSATIHGGILTVKSPDETVARFERTAGSGFTAIDIKDGVGTTGNSAIRFSDTGASKGEINYEHADDSLRITTNASEQLRITSAGNVGIGTTTPPEKLTVEGNISASGRISLSEGASSTAGQGLRFRNRNDLGLFEHGFDLGIMAPDSVQIHIDSNDNDPDTRYFAIVKDHNTVASQAGLIFKVREDATVSIYSHLSASGNISSSGELFISASEANHSNVLVYSGINNNGKVHFTSSAGLSAGLDTFKTTGVRTGDGFIDGNVTASGDISASGIITAASMSIGGNYTIGQSVVQIREDVRIFDGHELRIGDGPGGAATTDLSLFHDGTDSFIKNRTGELRIEQTTGNTVLFNAAADGEIHIILDEALNVPVNSGRVLISGSAENGVRLDVEGKISASGHLFASASLGFQNIATYNSESGQFFYTSSAGLASGLDTFKTTGLRTGDGFIDGDITGSNELLIQKSSGEGTPTFGTSNVAIFQNNDNNQDASIAIIAADSKKSQIHFGKHDDIDVGGIRYFHEDHATAPDQLHLRVNSGIAGIFAPVLSSKRGLRLGDDANISGSEGDILSIQGQLGGNGLTISSSAGTRIKFKRGVNNNQHLFEYFTGGIRKWSLGNAGEGNDNFYLYNTDSNVKFIELVDGGNSTHIHTNVTASGAISASGQIFGGLTSAATGKLVYYNTTTGELSQEDVAKALDAVGLLSSSAQIATDISGAFTSVSASVATNIATNVTNITNNTTAINTLNAAGLISSSGLGSPAQGEAQLTLNNVPQVTIDLGLQITDNVTFNHITASGNISASGNIITGGNVSASGHLFASASLDNNTSFKTVVYNTASGQFFHTTLSPGDAVISVTTGDANTITIGGTATQPTVAANTAVVSNGSLNLVTGDHVYDFVNAATGSFLTSSPFTAAGISGSSNPLIGSAVFSTAISGAFTDLSSSVATNIEANSEGITTNATAINNINLNPLFSATLISASSLSSPAQGEAQLTINGVAQTAVDLGLQVSDNVKFNNLETAGFITASGRLIIHDNLNQGSIFHASSSNVVTIHNPGPSKNSLFSYGNIQVGNSSNISNITASGNISASGKIFGGLTTQNYANVVYYNTSTGELTQDTAVKLLDAEGLLSSSAQIATDISGAFNGVTGSFLLNTTDTLTGDLTVTNDITASGNISASGEGYFSKVGVGTDSPSQGFHVVDAGIITSEFESLNNTSALIEVSNNAGLDAFFGVYGGNLVLRHDDYTANHFSMDTSGNITASGNISASGNMFATHITLDTGGVTAMGHVIAGGAVSASLQLYGGLSNTVTDNIVFYNPSGGELTYGSAGGIGGGLLSSSAQIATDISGASLIQSVVDTTGQTGINFTVDSNGQLSAVASGVETTDNVTFNHITASGGAKITGVLELGNGDIKSDNSFDFLSTGGSAQQLRIGKLGMSASYSGVDTALSAMATTNAAVFGGDVAVGPHDNGKLGVGILTPASLLHVKQDDSSTGTSNGITIENDGSGDATLQFLLTSIKRWVVGIDNSDSDKFKIADSADLNSNALFTIDGDGKVGIGTTSPAEKLEIHSGSLQIDTTGEGIKFGGTGAPSTNKIQYTSANNLQLDFDGAVQFISTNADITNGADLVLRNDGSTNIMRLTNEAASGTGANAGRIDIKAASTTKVSITGSQHGRIGIGTTTPKKALHVENSGILIDGASTLDGTGFTERFIIDAGASTAHTFLQFKNDNGGQLTVTGAGNVSASGNLFASVTDSSDTSFKTVMYNGATGQFFSTGSYGGGSGGGADNLGNHTATQDLEMDGNQIISSSNIMLSPSSSGDISAPGTNDNVIIGASKGFGTARQFGVQTNEGMIKIGPANNSFCHVVTDMEKMYFRVDPANNTDNAKFVFDGFHTGNFTGPVVLASLDTDLILRRDHDDTDYNQIKIGDDSLEIKLSNDIRFAINSVGDITINDPGNSAGDFITINSGVLKKRTASDVLSDIGAQAAGTYVTSVSSGDANTITIGGTTVNPTVAANTAAVSNGSLNLVTGDAVHSYAVAINSTDYVNDILEGGGIDIFQQGSLGGGIQATVSFDPGGGAGELITSGDTSGGSDLYESHSTLIYDGTDLQVHGGDIIAFYQSDKRLKDNVTPISNPIKKILQIGGYTFDWNKKQNTYKGHDIGVIAQEIEKVLPEVVETRENGYKAVKYQKIVPLLIEAIKDQQKQIDELKNLIKNGNR